MRSWMIAFCVGVACIGWLPELPTLRGACLTALLLIAILLFFSTVHLRLSFFAAMTGAFLIGAMWGLWYGHSALERRLPPALEGVDFWLSGSVVSLPRINGRAQQFDLKVEASCLQLHPDDCEWLSSRKGIRRVRLNYYGEHAPAPGETWRFRVRLNRPHGFANPGGFDYELMLLQSGIDAKGYVRDTEFNRQTGVRHFSLAALRYRLRERLLTLTEGLPQQGILLALAMGERDGVEAGTRELFVQTGTIHLLVISGLHVGFAAMFGYLTVNGGARLFPTLLLHWPAQKFGAVGAVFAALLYSLLAGFSLPTQRAVIMVCVFMAGRMLGRQFPVSLGYCTAMSLVLLLDPLAATSAGFWLSFVAVGALLLAFACRREDGEMQPWWRRMLRWSHWGQPQWVVFVGMFVPLAVWMQQISLLSPLANVLAIPLVSLLVVPLCLLGLLLMPLQQSLAAWFLTRANDLLEGLIWILRAGTQSFARLSPEGEIVWDVTGASPASLALAALGCVLILLPSGFPARKLAPLMFLPWLLPRPLPAPAHGEVWLNVMDVGQGLAVVIRTATNTLVYDTGPRFNDSFDAGRGVLQPFLAGQRLSHLDLVVISHGDNDHVGGLESLLAATPAQRLLAGTPVPGAESCSAGQHWEWDGVQFTVLHPESARSYRKRNDYSCVLQVRTGDFSALLTGDIEQLAEVDLLNAHGDRLGSDIVLAPHHGSNSSSQAALVRAISPRYVVYSAGYRNQFGHPDPLVRQRYMEAGAQALTTAEMGMISFRFSAGGLQEPVTYRQTRRRYWSAGPP